MQTELKWMLQRKKYWCTIQKMSNYYYDGLRAVDILHLDQIAPKSYLHLLAFCLYYNLISLVIYALLINISAAVIVIASRTEK
jgi:hypothetical protein